MSKFTEVLFSMTGSWSIAREMSQSIPKEVLRELTEEWTETQKRLERDPYSRNPFEIRDRRNSDKGGKLRAMMVKTMCHRSAPSCRYHYSKSTIEGSWTSSGLKVGEEKEAERYISKDFFGVSYERKVDHSIEPSAIKLRHQRHGWAVVKLVDETGGDDYDWPEVSHNYVIILV